MLAISKYPPPHRFAAESPLSAAVLNMFNSRGGLYTYSMLYHRHANFYLLFHASFLQQFPESRFLHFTFIVIGSEDRYLFPRQVLSPTGGYESHIDSDLETRIANHSSDRWGL